jgi:hypothetical protein
VHLSQTNCSVTGCVAWVTKAILAIALASSTAYAKENRPFKVGIEIDGISKPFAKLVSKLELKMPIDRTKCSAEVRATCQYQISGNVALVANGANPMSPADGLILVGGKDTDATSLMLSMGILMGLFDPELGIDQRGVVTKKLFEIAKTGQVGSADGRDAKYQLTINSVGIFFTMTAVGPTPAAPRESRLKTLPGSNYIIVWKDKASHDEALGIINSGVTEDKLPLLERLVSCRADAGTSVLITDAGWLTHDILILEGPQKGCRGNIPAEEVLLND